MMYCVVKLMEFALKVMILMQTSRIRLTLGRKGSWRCSGVICIKNEEFAIKHKELCVKNEEFCIKHDELCRWIDTKEALAPDLPPQADMWASWAI